MSGMKDKASGDYAPSRSPYFDIGRFRLTVNGGMVWIRDLESGEPGQPYDWNKLEAALERFTVEEF